MKVKWIIGVAVVVLVIWGWVRVQAKKEQREFDQVMQDAERRAAFGDKNAELMVKTFDSFEKNGNLSDVDPKLIMEVFLPKAKAGNVEAEYIVGMVYYGREEMTEAAHWLELAAEHWNKEAYYYIGSLYFAAMGVERDYKKAEKYLLKAAEQNNVMAEAMLMTLYSRGGDGIPRDTGKALYWAEKAAAGGNAQAQLYLGIAYRDGLGVDIDYGKAQRYIELAAEQLNDPLWWGELGALYLNIEGKYTGVVIDKEKGFRLLKKAADSGIAEAQSAVGDMYFKGYYVEQDYEKAYKWYILAADQEYPLAMLILGGMYDNGYYVQKDMKKAIEYYKRSADKGNAIACSILGCIYEEGKGVEIDISKAISYFRKGAVKGEELSIKRLSKLSDK